MRRPFHLRRPAPNPDEKFKSVLTARLINYVMRNGKKATAQAIVYSAFDKIQQETKKPAQNVFEEAITNVAPLLEVKSRRIGGATYQVPVEVRPERKTMLALRWIVESARAKQGKPMEDFLSEEILDAFRKSGSAFKKREEMHKVAEANKAFAHFARY